MYKTAVRWMIRRGVRDLNAGNPDPQIAAYADDAVLVFPGNNTWSGEYRGREAIAGFMRRFAEAGFQVGVLLAPLLPGLSDTEESIDATFAAIARSGAASVTALPLHLRPGAREWYSRWLASEYPRLLPRYRDLFGPGSYSRKTYQAEVAARVRDAARRHGLDQPTATATPVASRRPGHEQLRLL